MTDNFQIPMYDTRHITITITMGKPTKMSAVYYFWELSNQHVYGHNSSDTYVKLTSI